MERFNLYLEKAGFLLGLDARYLFRNGFYVSLRYGVISGVGLLLSVAFARLLMPEAYGKYQLALTILAFLSVLSLPGMNLAAMKAAVSGRSGGILSATRLCFRSSSIAVPLLLMAAGYYWREGQIDMAWALVLCAPAFPFFYALNTWYVYYESVGDFRAVAWRSMILAVIPGMLVLGGLGFGWSFPILLFILFVSTATINVLLFGEVRRKVGSDNQAEQDVDRAYGRAVTFQKFILGLSEILPPIAIGFVYGYREVAFFQVAYFSVNAFSGYIGAVSAIYMPKLFSLLHLQHAKIFLSSFLAGVTGVAGVVAFLSLLFPVLYGTAYSESLNLAWFFAPLALLLPGKAFLVSFFTAKEKNYRLTGVYVLANIVAFAVFASGREHAFVLNGALYIYLLNGITVASLTYLYRRETASEKIASI